MFGRKGLTPPPPQGPNDGFDAIVAEGGKIDRAMCASIALLTQVLIDAGRDPGALAMAGPVPADVAGMIADCIVYNGEKGREYATLGITRDFEAFSYQPHCYLFVIANTIGIAQDLPVPEMRAQLAAPQAGEPLFHAHVMRRWVRHVRPIGKALAAQDMDGLTYCMNAVQEDIAAVIRAAPQWLREQVDLVQLAQEWAAGFPATIGRPLDSDVKRLNDIPMTDFVHETLVGWLARLQADGLRDRNRAA
jgi:hypothetical protein